MEDLKSFGMGAVAWALAVPAVQLAGGAVAQKESAAVNKFAALIVGVGVAYVTTPLLSRIMAWKTPQEKVRGIAIALGVAQTIDGLLHFFAPDFYSTDKDVALASAGNIFLGAGLLGIFSAYQ